jgi:glycosyltransferase involved in cell wall biosynthesis
MPQESRQFDVLFVGRIAPNKGLFTLIDAIAQVKTTHPDIRLGILGSGPLRNALDTRIASLQLNANVTFIPRTETAEDLARIYNRAAMLVCASTGEGGPRVTVEAMACGVPVISTPVGIMAELIEDGDNGLIFLWDSSQLADKIRLLLGDEARRLRLAGNGRQSVQKFGADHVIERYARAYLDLIQRLQRQGTR